MCLSLRTNADLIGKTTRVEVILMDAPAEDISTEGRPAGATVQ